jgi:hypothetical protein
MGAAGIIIPSVVTLAIAESEAIIFGGDLTTPRDLVTHGPWTPPQYSKPALTILTVPAKSNLSSGQLTSSQINYVFDAVLKLAHRRTLRKTQHPVLTGANISDHAYVEPSKVVLNIGMSDAMSSYNKETWEGAATKSVSAWQILKTLQLNKTLLQLTTRLDTYVNMLITDLSADDDNKTLHALRATIVLEEIISASVTSTPNVSARPQTSDTSQGGVIQSTSPNAAQVQQNVIPSTLWPNTPTYPNVPGAGVVSSTSLGSVPGR